MRIGIGYDIHKLIPCTQSDFKLAGISIPFEKRCVAHSDGDVAIHALIDALLGAAALGDIGTHFPDTDPKYKNADSAELLAYCLPLLESNGNECWSNFTLSAFLYWGSVSGKCVPISPKAAAPSSASIKAGMATSPSECATHLFSNGMEIPANLKSD